MKTRTMLKHAFRENGTTAVEFAFVVVVFLSIVLGIMEFGRVLYVWNTVQEVTRRAAREAVVRSFADATKVSRRAIFSSEDSDGNLPGGPEITNTFVKINYLNGTFLPADPMPADPADNLSACGDSSRTTSCIRYVEACVATGTSCTGFVRYAPMAGLFPFLAIDIPVSSVVMPVESLGFNISE